MRACSPSDVFHHCARNMNLLAYTSSQQPSHVKNCNCQRALPCGQDDVVFSSAQLDGKLTATCCLQEQSKDQTFTCMNEALKVSCQQGLPVRVVRSYKVLF